MTRLSVLLCLFMSACGTTTQRPAATTAEHDTSEAEGLDDVEPAQPNDDGSLPVVWRVPGGPVAGLHHGAELLAVDTADAVLWVDAQTGDEIRRFSPPPRASSWDDAPRVEVIGESILIEPEPNVFGVYARDGSERWRVACSDPIRGACRVRAIPVGELVVVATGRPYRDLVAFDAASGERRWTHTVDLGFSAEDSALATDGHRVFAGQRRLFALEAATGTVAWDAECDPAFASNPNLGRGPAECERVVTDGTHVAAIQTGGAEVFVLDAQSGALVREIHALTELGFSVRQVALQGNQLIIGGSRNDLGLIAAVDLGSGDRLWDHELGERVSQVVVDGDEVWVRGTLGALWRLARGEVISRWGLDQGNRVALVAGRVVVDAGDQGVLALDPARAHQADPEIRITGTASLTGEVPAASALRVRVGDVLVEANASGAFEAVVRGRGGVQVYVEPSGSSSGCDRFETVFVRADAAGDPIMVSRELRTCRRR